jgi:hypothetical protein
MLHAIADSTSLSSATWATNLVPAVGGAAAGALSWIPVYPIDVVKTNQQVCKVHCQRQFGLVSKKKL